MSYFVELTTIEDTKNIEAEWTALQEIADCSYFQSWGWIGTWLREVVNDLEPELVRVWDRNELIALGIFVKSTVLRGGFLASGKLFLNEAPVSNRNMVIEYNGLLVKPGHEQGAYKAIIYHLRYSSKDWDELFMTLIRKSVTDTFVDELDDEFYLSIDRETKSWQVNSSTLSPGKHSMLATLSKNRRCQVNKAFRAYELEGEIYVRESNDVEEALKFFEGLKHLHTARWLAKGKPGSFSNKTWGLFHQALIKNRFPLGEIQLLEVGTPKTVIGYIYSFIWRGRVYVLQTGFNMKIPKDGQPGYVSHIEAILHNQEKGNLVYDLLCDDSGYKNILCNESESLVSISLKRKTLRSMLRQISTSSLKEGYVQKVIRGSVADKIHIYGNGTLDYLKERWIRLSNKWPSLEKKYLLVGSESSGTTAVSDLLFKEVDNLRYLEEGEQQWVWKAYRSVYQKNTSLRNYPRLQLFDAIKVPGFSVIINEFLKEFPNTTVVYLIRDPRDFASSAIKTWKIRQMGEFKNIPWTDVQWLGVDCADPVERLAQRWKAYLTAAMKVDGVIFIKYEDFCQDKVGVISSLCKTLNLPFDKARVTQLCDIQLSHASVRAYRPSGPGGWQHSILEREHIEKIETICKEEMLKWGYKLTSS
ncbi:MAG: GNAT family N-acetyltransferase [Gammaproteobacteria bacterium]|nr:GNAT family N-acetyltransferase [Gammaproteobacteria bacterium]